MEELLQKIQEIQEIVRNETTEIKTKLDNIETDVNELKEDVSVLKTDVNELKEDVSVLKTDVNELKEDVSALKTDNGVLRESMFIMENDYFKKIDVMYDYVLLQKELNDIKFNNMNKVEKTVKHNELKILNHETRIEFLENNLNQSV